MTHAAKYFVALVIIAPLFLMGCATKTQQNAKQDAPADVAATDTDGGLPENDCLTLTADKVQQLCQSGPLQRKISLVSGGYECEYQALDPTDQTKPTLGTELKLTYFNGPDDMADLKESLKRDNKTVRIGDISKGFYAAWPRWADSTTKLWSFDFYRQIGSLTTILYGTDIDYVPMDMSQELGCSFSEMWNLLSEISHEDLSQERANISAQITDEISPPDADKTEIKNEPNCCTIMIVEVTGEADVRRDGKASPATKGQILNDGDEIITGDNSHVSVAFLNCHFGDDTSDYGLAVIQSDSMGRITKTSDGKPSISFDPGVAHVSVKELQTFETDFQVSTPRLTCAVRG